MKNISLQYKYQRIIYENKILWVFLVSSLLLILGAAMNFKAVESNNCKMPVYQSDINTIGHLGFWDKSEVNLFYFTDRFDVGESIWSIGDFFLLTSGILTFWNIYSLFFNKLNRRKK